jgi:hypothetical protein
MWCQPADWMNLAWNMKKYYVALNIAINFPVSQNAANFVTNLATVGYRRNTLLHGISYVSCIISLALKLDSTPGEVLTRYFGAECLVLQESQQSHVL